MSQLSKQMSRLDQYSHAFQIAPHSSVKKQDLYPKPTVKETTTDFQQQHYYSIKVRIAIKQTPNSYRIEPHHSMLNIAPHSSVEKQYLYPIATVNETTTTVIQQQQQQHWDRIEARIQIKQPHNSLRIDPHPTMLNVAPIREFGHPQTIPPLYSASQNDINYSPFRASQPITTHLNLQHSITIDPHPSMVFVQQIAPCPERINLHP